MVSYRDSSLKDGALEENQLSLIPCAIPPFAGSLDSSEKHSGKLCKRSGENKKNGG